MPDSANPTPPAARDDPGRHLPAACVYAGPRTDAARDWLERLEVDHGALARAGAELLLARVDTRRFQPTVAPGDPALEIALHDGRRRTVAAELRADSGLLALCHAGLAAASGGDEAVARLAGRLEALAPAWFRGGEPGGGCPSLELAACADEAVAAGVAALLDDALVAVLRARRLAGTV